jgi:hypothetical protein
LNCFNTQITRYNNRTKLKNQISKVKTTNQKQKTEEKGYCNKIPLCTRFAL